MATAHDDSILVRTRAGAVADRLRELIRSGELPPGTHLRQDEFADRFGVSTTPVREAFVTLEMEGLVRRHPHRGFVVFMPSVEELRELYEIRAVVESLATEIATRQLSEDDLAALGRTLARMRDAKPRSYLKLNAEFHDRIYAAARRPRLREMIDALREPAANYISMNVDLYDQSYRAETQGEHEAILEALGSRAAKRAARAMHDHLDHSARHIMSLIDKSQIAEPGPSRR
jgi:DNA-binding GntR family transcriptional regulator